MAATTGIGALFIVAVIAALAAAKGTSGTDGSSGTDTMPGPAGTMGPATVSTLIALLAEAIATAEGFFKAGSLAQRQNNPGNLTDPATGAIRIFDTVDQGWQALYDQIGLFFSGSGYYNSGMSLAQIGDRYANHDPAWAANVATYIGVPVTTTLDQLAAQYG